MMANKMFSVKTWTGEVKEVKKIVFFPERDVDGNIFYKLEGQVNTDYFMIHYYYDKEKALNEFIRLLNELIVFQTKCLEDI